jgi:hypothetical protein
MAETKMRDDIVCPTCGAVNKVRIYVTENGFEYWDGVTLSPIHVTDGAHSSVNCAECNEELDVDYNDILDMAFPGSAER